jgi:hypothetical protein
LRFWPKRKWKQILLVLVLTLIVIFVAFAAFAGLLLAGIISREVVSEIEVINADGGKTA